MKRIAILTLGVAMLGATLPASAHALPITIVIAAPAPVHRYAPPPPPAPVAYIPAPMWGPPPYREHWHHPHHRWHERKHKYEAWNRW